MSHELEQLREAALAAYDELRTRFDVVVCEEGLERAIASGAQVYWVCPLIEESEKLELQTAVALHADLTGTLKDSDKDLRTIIQGGTPGAYIASFTALAQLADLWTSEIKAVIFGFIAAFAEAEPDLAFAINAAGAEAVATARPAGPARRPLSATTPIARTSKRPSRVRIWRGVRSCWSRRRASKPR